MLYLGIDPGKSGAIAALNDDGNIVDVFKGSETEHDIANWLRATILADGAKAVIEQVHAMRKPGKSKQGTGSAFTFGQSYGFLRGLIVAYQIPFTAAVPVKWQNAMQCRTGGDKNVSKAAAQRLWPTFRITHANADALLIAEFCRRTNKERA